MSTPPPAGDDLHDRRLAEGRRMFVLAAATLERDVLLHGLIEDEQNVLVGAVLNAADRIAALEVVRSTREGEIERLTLRAEMFLDLWEKEPNGADTVRAAFPLRQALNKGTDDVG